LFLEEWKAVTDEGEEEWGHKRFGNNFSNAKELCIHNPDKDLEAVGIISCLI
jgi:hypothetical protein